MIYFTSDLHFGHAAVIDYCKRPFTGLDKMHTTLIKRWNERIKPQDTVYVLGDMALCPYREFEPIGRQLQGNKILVRGNHDHYSESQYRRMGFVVYHEVKLKIAGQMLRLSHLRQPPWYLA